MWYINSSPVDTHLDHMSLMGPSMDLGTYSQSLPFFWGYSALSPISHQTLPCGITLLSVSTIICLS